MDRARSIEEIATTLAEEEPIKKINAGTSESQADTKTRTQESEPCFALTSCPELSAARSKVEDRIEAQRRAERLRELEAMRERAKLD